MSLSCIQEDFKTKKDDVKEKLDNMKCVFNNNIKQEVFNDNTRSV